MDDTVLEVYMLPLKGELRNVWEDIEEKAKNKGKRVDSIIQDLLLEWLEKEG